MPSWVWERFSLFFCLAASASSLNLSFSLVIDLKSPSSLDTWFSILFFSSSILLFSLSTPITSLWAFSTLSLRDTMSLSIFSHFLFSALAWSFNLTTSASKLFLSLFTLSSSRFVLMEPLLESSSSVTFLLESFNLVSRSFIFFLLSSNSLFCRSKSRFKLLASESALRALSSTCLFRSLLDLFSSVSSCFRDSIWSLNAFMPSWVWERFSLFFCLAASASSLNLSFSLVIDLKSPSSLDTWFSILFFSSSILLFSLSTPITSLWAFSTLSLRDTMSLSIFSHFLFSALAWSFNLTTSASKLFLSLFTLSSSRFVLMEPLLESSSSVTFLLESFNLVSRSLIFCSRENFSFCENAPGLPLLDDLRDSFSFSSCCVLDLRTSASFSITASFESRSSSCELPRFSVLPPDALLDLAWASNLSISLSFSISLTRNVLTSVCSSSIFFSFAFVLFAFEPYPPYDLVAGAFLASFIFVVMSLTSLVNFRLSVKRFSTFFLRSSVSFSLTSSCTFNSVGDNSSPSSLIPSSFSE